MSAPTSIPGASKSARGENNGVDRLSSLCDELLHHVMSFLPMPEVVRTSLLSPRWRNLWASTPVIHIDGQDFKVENNPYVVDEDKLEKFGDHLLRLRDGAVCLDEARIFVSRKGSRKSCVWIRHAIKHKMEDCTLRAVEISSSSLKVLRMIRCHNSDVLLICARNLTHLSILDPACDGPMVTRDLSSLVTASVIISSEEFHNDMDRTVEGHRLLDGLSHATTLELHAPLHELAFERGLRTCPVFSNLTSLVLGDWCMASALYPLLRILQCSSKLKELILKLKMEECSICKYSEYALLPEGTSLLGAGSYPSLERIKIYRREDDGRLGALVQALLLIFPRVGKIGIEGC